MKKFLFIFFLLNQMSFLSAQSNCTAHYTYSVLYPDSLTLQFTDQSILPGNNVHFNWSFGDGTGSLFQNPSHTFSTSGWYHICLTIYDSICQSTYCEYIFIGNPNDTINSNNCQSAFGWYPGNVPYNVGFYDSSSGNNIQSWYWTFGDGTTSTDQHPFHSFGGPGFFQVCLTITAANNCTSTWCDYVQVDTFYFCHNNIAYQTSGNSVYLNGSHSGAPAVNYQWYFGDGTTGTGQQVTHTYSVPGTYNVTLVSSDTVGCTAISDQIIVINGGGFNQIYGQVYGGNYPILQGYVLLFSDDVNPAQTSYFAVTSIDSMGFYVFSQVPYGDYYILAVPINLNGYLPTYYGNEIDWANATLITLPQASNPYHISLIPATGSQGNGPGTIHGTVNGSPAFRDVINNMKILLFDENQNPITYSGVEGNSFSFSNLGFNTFYINPQLPGYQSEMKQIALNEENPNALVSITIEGTHVVLDVQENVTQLSIHGIYPNPSEHTVRISLYSSDSQMGILRIFDTTGKPVYENMQILHQGENEIMMDVSGLSNGVYLIQLTTANGQISSQKFLKR